MEKEFSNEALRNKRYEQAVSVCAELFLERGIENVKMTDIADESGIGVATLYRWFGTKTGIAIAAATFMWKDIRELFSGAFESDVFKMQSGLKQLVDLMKLIVVLYKAHSDFLKFIGDFDMFLLHEKTSKEELTEYEKTVIDFFPLYEAAYIKGCEDGTVRKGIDYKLMYLTFTHALTEMSQKFIRGEILPNDDFSDADKELEMLIETAEYYFSAQKG